MKKMAKDNWTSNKKKEKKWRIELTEHQLMLMAKCVEDCHRFIGG